MEFDIYSIGPVSMSVCVSEDMSREEIERRANAESPTGISSRWSISDEPTFANGDPMPCPCNTKSDRQHWLLHC